MRAADVTPIDEYLKALQRQLAGPARLRADLPGRVGWRRGQLAVRVAVTLPVINVESDLMWWGAVDGPAAIRDVPDARLRHRLAELPARRCGFAGLGGTSLPGPRRTSVAPLPIRPAVLRHPHAPLGPHDPASESDSKPTPISGHSDSFAEPTKEDKAAPPAGAPGRCWRLINLTGWMFRVPGRNMPPIVLILGVRATRGRQRARIGG
jgi:hypothetical protein